MRAPWRALECAWRRWRAGVRSGALAAASLALWSPGAHAIGLPEGTAAASPPSQAMPEATPEPTPALTSRPEAPPRYGLVVGHNGALDAARPALRFADDDAVRFAELLRAQGAQVTLLTALDAESKETYAGLRPEGAPTEAALAAAVATLRAAVTADVAAGRAPEVWFFYAGHGDVEDGEGYVALEGGRWRRRALWQALVTELPAHRLHLVVDACKSYFLVGGRGPGGREEPYQAPFAGPRLPPHVGVVLSTSADAESHEWAALPGGIFSHEVRSAALGAADADVDGRVDYEELAAFVGLANASVSVPRYRPQVYIRPPAADPRAVFFAPAHIEARSRLRIEAATHGRLSIVDGRGLRYLDTHKSPAGPLEVALLAPRRYEVRLGGRTYDLEAERGDTTLAAARPVADGVAVAARPVAHRAFESLFARPFDAGVVSGYRLGLAGAPAGVGAAATSPERDARAAWRDGLLIGGTAGALAAGTLAALALRAQDQAGRAAQVDRGDLNDRAFGLGMGAVGVGSAALGALVGGLWLLVSAPPSAAVEP